MDYLRRHLNLTEVFNFSPGPCTLPRSVLEQASNDLITWDVSAAEMSHRSADFQAIALRTEFDLRKLLSVPDNFHVFFLPGGATMQFAGVPYNLAGGIKKVTNYLTTGLWSQQAFKDGAKLSQAREVWSQEKP